MSAWSRVAWLPAVAVLLPCTFIGVVGYLWLALEHETTGRRSAAAADSAVSALRQDLATALAGSAVQARESALARGQHRGPLSRPERVSDLASDAYLFDVEGHLVAPDPDGAIRRATDAYLAETAVPAWEQARELVEASDGGNAPSRKAIDALLTHSTGAASRAGAHLVIARAWAAAGQPEAAIREAREIVRCCPDARDASGVSIALYAAALRATFLGVPGPRPESMTALTDDLRELIEQGDIGVANDLVTLNLVAERAGLAAAFAPVRDLANHARAELDVSRTMSALAAKWVSRAEAPQESSNALTVRVLQAVPRVVAARIAGASGGQLVLVLDEVRLSAWVATWSAQRGGFDMTVLPETGSPEAGDASSAVRARAAFTRPLVPDAPVGTVALAFRSSAGEDAGRQRLFAALVVAAVLLALGLGILAIRDVGREVRLATLRASFVAGVTHELKTPLASIRLIAETLRGRRARPESRDDLLDTIVDETDRLTRLVDNVLSSSRIESGTQRYALQVVSLAGAVQRALDRVTPVLRRDGFAVLTRLDANVQARVDPDALGLSVINLVGNAAKYSGASREIEVTVGCVDGQAELSVTDHGIGIDVADQERIFERFYRAPNAVADTTGAGLGLALVRHFVEAHGGTMSVASAPGRGSVFTLRLPVASREGA